MNIPKSTSEIIKNLNINEYELVCLINKRTRELMHGAKALIENKSNDFVEIAIQELLSGKIKPQSPNK